MIKCPNEHRIIHKDIMPRCLNIYAFENRLEAHQRRSMLNTPIQKIKYEF